MPVFKKHIFFLFISFFLSVSLFAQDHGFFNQTWLEQGLSQSSIISIIQDKQGFMWFATQDGLNRYDGKNMDHFNFKPFAKQSISGDDIYAICIRDSFLFLLNDKGLDKINLADLSITNLKKESADKSPVFFRCWSINNNIYLMNREGLFLCSVNSNNEYATTAIEFRDSALKGNPPVFALCGDKDQNIYAASTAGIFIQKKGGKYFERFLSGGNTKHPEELITCIAYSEGCIYYTGNSTLFCHRLETNSTHSMTLNETNSISSLLVDRKGNIWMGTNLQGVFVAGISEKDSLYLKKHFSKTGNRFGLQSSQIASLYQNTNSNDDIVWIGSRDAGAFNFSYSKNSFSIPTSFVSSSDPNYFGITKDKDGIIWAGYSSGILCLNRELKSYSFIGLSDPLRRINRPVEAICTDENNNVWFGYGNSLYLIDKKSKIYIQKVPELISSKGNQVSKIIPLNKEELLICTSRGLVQYNTRTNDVKQISEMIIADKSVKIENVSSFLSDSKKNWWIGGSAGVYCLKKDGNSFLLKHDNNDSNSILSNRVMDIKEAPGGEILLATTKGLSIVDATGKKVRNIFSAKNLVNNFIYGVLGDENGKFWMSTNFGLSVFDAKSGQFKSYTASDGIVINEFNSGGFFRAADGELLFGGLGGIVSIYPKEQVLNKNVSSIILRKIITPEYTRGGNDLSPLKLTYWQNDIYFEFSVPDYSGEGNVDLYYRFNNKDTNLIKVTTSKLFALSFINIAPGRYDLEVLAINKEGARSFPFKYSFTVNDPFWTTWWFYFIFVTLTVLTSWLIYRSRLRRKIEYIQQIEQIRKDENEKVRKAATLDLHDEFGNGLTRISMLIEMIKLQISNENSEAQKLLDVISQNSGRLYQGTKDFIWSINPGKDNMYEIIIRIKDYADEVFYGTNINFKLSGLDENLKELKQTPTAGRNIAMIFKESLSNILKHAKASNVQLSVVQDSDNITLELEDDGIGFEMKDYKNSFGLSNIQQRAMRSSATLSISSVPAQGTRIKLNITFKNKEDDSNT